MKAKPTIKDLRTGTYVTRRVYNTVCEENKRLRLDIRRLIDGTHLEQTEVKIRWRVVYKKESEFNALLKEIFGLKKK